MAVGVHAAGRTVLGCVRRGAAEAAVVPSCGFRRSPLPRARVTLRGRSSRRPMSRSIAPGDWTRPRWSRGWSAGRDGPSTAAGPIASSPSPRSGFGRSCPARAPTGAPPRPASGRPARGPQPGAELGVERAVAGERGPVAMGGRARRASSRSSSVESAARAFSARGRARRSRRPSWACRRGASCRGTRVAASGPRGRRVRPDAGAPRGGGAHGRAGAGAGRFGGLAHRRRAWHGPARRCRRSGRR